MRSRDGVGLMDYIESVLADWKPNWKPEIHFFDADGKPVVVMLELNRDLPRGGMNMVVQHLHDLLNGRRFTVFGNVRWRDLNGTVTEENGLQVTVFENREQRLTLHFHWKDEQWILGIHEEEAEA